VRLTYDRHGDFLHLVHFHPSEWNIIRLRITILFFLLETEDIERLLGEKKTKRSFIKSLI
jgi:hypothetical protein